MRILLFRYIFETMDPRFKAYYIGNYSLSDGQSELVVFRLRHWACAMPT